MRIELDDNKDKAKDEKAQSEELAKLIKEQDSRDKPAFSELSGKKKAEYIWYYYKWWFICGIIGIVLLVNFIKDYRENSKPTYLYVEMVNTYFGLDGFPMSSFSFM